MKIFLFVIIVLTSTPWINAYDGKPENFRSGVCGLKRIAGPCREYFPRYYFNKDTQECRPFIYGGCRGNGNNFEKRGECENICVNTNITEICGKDDDCLNGGKCIAYGKYRFCECLLGTEGVFCSEVTTCKTNPSFCGTGNETICSYDSAQRRAVCQCLNSSRKYDNKEKICRDPCQDGECENGGKCTGNGNFKYCECLRGTTGSLCSEITDCNKADFCGINNNTICKYDIKGNYAICECINPREEFNHIEMVCEESCQADKCENGGVCLVGFGSNCRCSNGTVSEFCSIVHILDCKKRKFCGTHNDSTCTYDKLHGKAVCQCTDPKKQFDYEERICKVPCGAENCENGGICDGKGDFKFCECLTGTSGDFCTEIPACRNGSLCGTSSDVRCVYDGIQQKSVCECLHTNAEFNNHTKKCGENNKSIFLALLGSLFAIFVIAFSILFHLRWRKHKAGDALYFNRLMERVGEE